MQKTPDTQTRTRHGFDREHWSTVQFASLDVGEIFIDPNRTDSVAFLALSDAETEAEGFVSPVLARWVAEIVRGNDRSLSSYGQVRYIGAPVRMRVGVNQSVSVRCDTYFRVWTEPAPDREILAPYLDAIRDCHCDLCTEIAYAVSVGHAGSEDRVRIGYRVLLDALRSGTHTRRELPEWTEICKQRHADSVRNGGSERGYGKADMRSFYATGMGLGMTPGGVGGTARR